MSALDQHLSSYKIFTISVGGHRLIISVTHHILQKFTNVTHFSASLKFVLAEPYSVACYDSQKFVTSDKFCNS